MVVFCYYVGHVRDRRGPEGHREAGRQGRSGGTDASAGRCAGRHLAILKSLTWGAQRVPSEGTAEWSATGLENRGGVKSQGFDSSALRFGRLPEREWARLLTGDGDSHAGSSPAPSACRSAGPCQPTLDLAMNEQMIAATAPAKQTYRPTPAEAVAYSVLSSSALSEMFMY